MGLLTLGFEETPTKFSSGVKVYAKEDNYLYMMTSTGVELKLAKASESNQLLPSGSIGSIQINKDNLSFSSFGNWNGTSFDIGSGKFIGDGSELTGLDFVPFEGADRDVNLGDNNITLGQYLTMGNGTYERQMRLTNEFYDSATFFYGSINHYMNGGYYVREAIKGNKKVRTEFSPTNVLDYLRYETGKQIIRVVQGDVLTETKSFSDFQSTESLGVDDYANTFYVGGNPRYRVSYNRTLDEVYLTLDRVLADKYDSSTDHIQSRAGVTKLTHADTLTTIHQALDVQGALTADSLTLDNNLTIVSTIRAIDVDTNGSISIADMGNDNGYVRLDGMTEHNLIKSLTSDKSSYKNFAIRAKSTGGSSITGDFVVDTFGNTIMYGSATVAGTSKTNGVTNYGSRNTEPTSPTYTLVAGDKYYLSVGLIGWYTYSGTAWVRDRVVSDFLDLDVTAPVNHVVTAINTDEPFLFWDALGVDSAKNFTLDVATGVYTYTGPSGVKFDGRLSFSGTGSTTNMVSELSIYVDTGSGFTRLTDSIYPVTYDSGAPSSGIQMTTAILNNGYKIKVMLRCTKTGTITFGYIKKQVRQV